MKRICLSLLPTLLLVAPSQAPNRSLHRDRDQSREDVPAEDMFSYMPACGKPVIGKGDVQKANAENFSGRTNVTRSWGSDHRIVSSPSGDMAYDARTQRMGYDEAESTPTSRRRCSSSTAPGIGVPDRGVDDAPARGA